MARLLLSKQNWGVKIPIRELCFLCDFLKTVFWKVNASDTGRKQHEKESKL